MEHRSNAAGPAAPTPGDRGPIEDAVAFTSRYVPGDFLREPRTIQQKLAWLKIFDNPPLKTRCADKLAARGYIEEKLGFDASVPVLGVWEDPADIDFDALPGRFVLKCNHGSGYNIVVRDKAALDREDAVRRLRQWLETDYAIRGYELCYRDVPRKCFAEEYIGDGVSDLRDYKFLCFNGEPRYCQVISDRSNGRRRLNYYDMDFRFVDFCRLEFPNNASIPDDRPAGFETMKAFARKLAEDFAFVRVDFFEANGRVYAGELTFVPGNARMKYRDDPGTGLFLGSLLRLYGEPAPPPPRPAPAGDGPVPDVSVVVPVYNGREFVRDCVGCLRAQTHGGVEFVVVDDGSSDGSAEAFEAETRGDPRFRVLRHERRTDLFHARRTGVLAARGRYVMFLDVDDLLASYACARVAEILDRTGADLFCYGTTVANIGRASDRDVADTQTYLDREPAHGAVTSAEECRALFFGPRAWPASAWNKAARTEIARAAFESVRTDRNLGCAQDYLQSVLLFLRIRSLWSDASEKLYVYRLGRGVSRLPKGEVTREKFERILTAAQVEDELRDLLARESGLPDGFKAFIADEFSSRVRAGTLPSLWNLPDEAIPWGFGAALSAWGVRALSSPAFDVGRLWDHLEAVRACSALRSGTDAEDGDRIGLYAGRCRPADVVPPRLADFLAGRGCSAVPVLERDADDDGGPAAPPGAEAAERLPAAPGAGLPRETIPPRDGRLEAWSRIVRERRLDAVWFLAPPPSRFAAETLALRAMGVRVFVWPESPGFGPADREPEAGTTATERTFDALAAVGLANGVVVAPSGDGGVSLSGSVPTPGPRLLSDLFRAAERDREDARARLDRMARTIDDLRLSARKARARIERLSADRAQARSKAGRLEKERDRLRGQVRRLERSLALRLARLPTRLFRLLASPMRRNGHTPPTA